MVGLEKKELHKKWFLELVELKPLRALGIKVDVYHFNEGHAVFAAIELIKKKWIRDMTFEMAWKLQEKK